MSVDNVNEAGTVDMICASCGIKEIDDVKLNKCDGGCDLARYCSDDCQQDHLEKHETICKERAAEIRDEILFTQPEISHLGDCPICFLPLSLDVNKSGTHTCCGKVICRGCFYANKVREEEQRLKRKCPFCRKQLPKTKADKEINKKMLMKRAEANDSVALRQLGNSNCKEGDYDAAFKYLTRAAELGDAMAHYNLAVMYREGHGVEKDEEMERYHLEEAAIAGHPSARYNLGNLEGRKGMYQRSVKHHIIAANLGHNESIQTLKKNYRGGYVSKDDLAAALRAHQAAVDATKSPQREEAEKLWGA